MVAGSWLDNDGKFRQYGTQKAAADAGGEFIMPGPNRIYEARLDLTTLTTLPLAIDYTSLFPASNTQIFVEKVEIDVEVASLGGTSFSVGTGFMTPGTLANPPAITAISNTAFVNAMIQAATTPAGTLLTLTAGSTYAGGYIGTTSADQTHKNYITALAVGTYTAGVVKLRIYYHGIPSITQ
jgi:hypothetical protein